MVSVGGNGKRSNSAASLLPVIEETSLPEHSLLEAVASLRRQVAFNQQSLIDLHEAYVFQEMDLKAKHNLLNRKNEEMNKLKTKIDQSKIPKMCNDLVPLE